MCNFFFFSQSHRCDSQLPHTVIFTVCASVLKWGWKALSREKEGRRGHQESRKKRERKRNNEEERAFIWKVFFFFIKFRHWEALCTWLPILSCWSLKANQDAVSITKKINEDAVWESFRHSARMVSFTLQHWFIYFRPLWGRLTYCCSEESERKSPLFLTLTCLSEQFAKGTSHDLVGTTGQKGKTPLGQP